MALLPIISQAAPAHPNRSLNPAALIDATSSANQAQASAVARRFGHDVVVSSLTTSTEQIVAQPDGLSRLTESTVPVRVRLVGVDHTLVRGADGTVSPKASAAAVQFSGGGHAALARIRQPTGTWVAQGWSAGSLPAPTLSGPTATYHDVYPGVDLVLTSTDSGFAEVLVVSSAVAAANPALRAVDGAIDNGDGTHTGVEVKSNSASRDAHQRNFDNGVSVKNPAVGTGQNSGLLITGVRLMNV